jgi:hypothetical protein
MVKIAFWDNCLCERGTTVSLYDYAYYNKQLLNNESIIMYNTTRKENDVNVIEKFKKEFEVYGVSNFDHVDDILKKTNCDIFYIIKAGDYEGQLSKVCKNVVHCVFSCTQPHGDVYSSIAPWVHGNNNKFPYVPHMINLPDNDNNLRNMLKIPEDAIVFGRHGGLEQFDMKYVHNIVYNIAKNFPNIYFLFMNTNKFCNELPNIIHIEKIIDLNKKVEFINTCDAMLWARSGGEIFSLSQGEFSFKNKPVIASNIGCDGHVHLLGDKCIWYNENTLHDILINFDRNEVKNKDWNAYRDYTPEKVMKIFKNVFID